LFLERYGRELSRSLTFSSEAPATLERFDQKPFSAMKLILTVRTLLGAASQQGQVA
jgi:hypothetical protein